MALKGFLVGSILTTGMVAGGLSIVAARHLPTVHPNVYVGTVSVGGLTADEAERKLRVWWETEKTLKLAVHVPGSSIELPDQTPGQLGVTLDDVASVARLPMDDLADDVKNVVDPSASRQVFPVDFKNNGADLKPLAALIRSKLPTVTQARAVYEDGQILLRHEVPPEELDTSQVPDATMKVLPDGTSVELPMKTGARRVPDQDLDQITDVVSQFSTNFPAYNRPRCSNIRLASSKLRGIILMPGDRLSFNGTVGRRTLKRGFKLAGIYKNGKHDVGIGGGICQVSTTLYNACLLADLKICQRSNHSLPVPYVPLGRDATVDYGALDLIVQNEGTTPVAIDSHYQTGRLTFRVLGKKDPTMTVKIVQAHARSWDPTVSTVIDHTLRPGTRRVVEKGSWGHSVTTYRLLYKDGQLLHRELLGHSTYGMQKRVVAYNPAVKALPKLVTPGIPQTGATPPPSAGG